MHLMLGTPIKEDFIVKQADITWSEKYMAKTFSLKTQLKKHHRFEINLALAKSAKAVEASY